MKRFASKLGFVHRALWQRQHAYRWAFLMGPPPLIGFAVATLVWAVPQYLPVHAASGNHAPWAHWIRPVVQGGQPFTEIPNAALPPGDPSGRAQGLQPGWVAGILPMTVGPTMDVDVKPTSLGAFTLDQPTIPLARVTEAGPPTGLFVGTAESLFIAREKGVYAFSARLTRAGTQSANCIVRLGLGHHRILRNEVLNASGDAVLNFPPVEFRLEPGLFRLELAVGCWRGEEMVGSGELALMVRHPGDAVLEPAAALEVMRPDPRHGSGVVPGAPSAR